MRPLVLLFLLTSLGTNFFARGQFIREGSIGKEIALQPAQQTDSCSFRPLSAMKGEKLIFLPQSKALQEYVYHGFQGGTGRYGHPTYKEAVGRIGVLTDIAPRPSVSGGAEYVLSVTMEGDQRVYTSVFVDNEPESIDGVAFIVDLECAKKRLLGRAIWYIGAGVDQNGLRVYDEATGKTAKVNLPKPVRLQVKEVVASWYSDTPVRLIVAGEDGTEAFVDISLSGINLSKENRRLLSFEDSFTLDDPHTVYNWPERAWQAVRGHTVHIGMTEEQAAMSWGKPFPSDIRSSVSANGKSDIWHFDSQTLYFENGVLTVIRGN